MKRRAWYGLAAAALLVTAWFVFHRQIAGGVGDAHRRVRRIAGIERPVRYDVVPRLDRAVAWLRGAALAPDDVRDRPLVMVVFTRTHPLARDFLRAAQVWHEAYGRLGLTVVGVHRPHLACDSDTIGLARDLARWGVTFPVAVDPEDRVARVGLRGASEERPMATPPPFCYLWIGTPGKAVAWRSEARFVSGNSTMREAEAAVQDLIAHGPRPRDGRRGFGIPPVVDFDGRQGLLFPLEPDGSGTREGPLADAPLDLARTYTTQFRYQEEGPFQMPIPVGRWILRRDGLEAARGGAAQFATFRYYAGSPGAGGAGVVASPPPDGPARLWILRDDGWPPADALGEDARREPDGSAYVEVTEPRLYRVLRGGGRHVLRLSPERAGMTLHAIAVVVQTP